MVVSSLPLPSGPTVRLGRSPMCGPCGDSVPCILCMGFQCPPAEAKSGALHWPTAWRWMPCKPGVKPLAITVILTPSPFWTKVAWPTCCPCPLLSVAVTGLRDISAAVAVVATRPAQRMNAKPRMELSSFRTCAAMRLNALNANVAKRRLAPHLLAWRVPMRAWTIGLLLGFAIATAACNKGQPEQKAGPITRQDIAWREGDVYDAFTEARETGKPVLLYWGAKWCPPCNQLKTTLFKDPEFITETRLFVPVYLDGDSKGAQAWGERFNITGYPSVIILRPDHSEITRLSSGSAATALADTLR